MRKSAFAAPEPLAQFLAASEGEAEEGALQQRVVDVPAAGFGVAVEDEEERHGGAGEPPQVDHAGAGPQRPVGEPHAVDVDQLEADGARRRVAAPEDVAVVEVPVLDSLFVELSGEAGEGFQHGDGSGRGEVSGGLRQGRVVRTARDVVAVAQQPVAAVFAPRDRFGRVDAQRPQPHGVFVGAAGFAPAEEGVDESLEQVRTAETFDRDPIPPPNVEGFDRVASGMEYLAAVFEQFGEVFREAPQAIRSGIDVNAHGGKILCCKVTFPRPMALVLFDCEVVLKRKRALPRKREKRQFR